MGQLCISTDISLKILGSKRRTTSQVQVIKGYQVVFWRLGFLALISSFECYLEGLRQAIMTVGSGWAWVRTGSTEGWD